MSATPNVKPPYFHEVSMMIYDGRSDDLLTGGLGWDGLKSNIPPKVSTPPTATELRRLAIFSNYRALVDMTEGGGYGVLFGPNVSSAGEAEKTPGAGKVAGIEYLGYYLDESGRPAATMMLQVPANFNELDPCIVVVPSPGSRGVYGGIAAGEWGLKHGCAVAYTDKGTGTGCHELATDTVMLIDGLTAKATWAGSSSHFTADSPEEERMSYNRNYPFRYAFKHAHSRRNPEKDWGHFVLRAIEFAFYLLNEQIAPEMAGTLQREKYFQSSNTRVIAFSVSNGGGAVLAAAEQDADHLIHAVVVGEPQVTLRVPEALKVTRGGRAVVSPGRPLFDYISHANVIQPCAAYAPSSADAPMLDLVDQASAKQRCRELTVAGLLRGKTFAEQAQDALQKLHEAGWEPESDLLHASYYGFEVTAGVAVTYANAYSRARVIDNLCGFSFATTTSDMATGTPAPGLCSLMSTLFGTGNGIPPTPPVKGIRLIYNDAAGGPTDHRSGDGDFALRGALRLRSLWTDPDPQPADIRGGVDEVRLTGNLHGKPAIIVHGRSDALLPVNHTSRPYFGMNKLAEGEASQLAYIEVENAQHFDTFIGLVPGYARYWLPLHYYNLQALDLMWDHLHDDGPLPASQVVRTIPRGEGTPPISVTANLRAISPCPAVADVIRFDRGSQTVVVPD